MKGYMKEVAHLLGVKLYEEFEVDYGKGRVATAKFKQSGLEVLNINFDFYGDINRVLLESLLNGSCTIKRKPWKPNIDESYYHVCPEYIERDVWCGDEIDITFYKLGNCYKTHEEAEANFDKWKSFYASDEVLGV